MKFSLAILLTIVLAFIGSLYLPWWSIAISSFLVSLLVVQRAGKAFLSGFMGILLLWCGLAWWIDNMNGSILATRIGALLGIGDNSLLLILITGLIGGIVGGFAAMSGSYLRASKTGASVA